MPLIRRRSRAQCEGFRRRQDLASNKKITIHQRIKYPRFPIPNVTISFPEWLIVDYYEGQWIATKDLRRIEERFPESEGCTQSPWRLTHVQGTCSHEIWWLSSLMWAKINGGQRLNCSLQWVETSVTFLASSRVKIKTFPAHVGCKMSPKKT